MRNEFTAAQVTSGRGRPGILCLILETGLVLLQGGCPQLGHQAQFLAIYGDVKRRAAEAGESSGIGKAMSHDGGVQSASE